MLHLSSALVLLKTSGQPNASTLIRTTVHPEQMTADTLCPVDASNLFALNRLAGSYIR